MQIRRWHIYPSLDDMIAHAVEAVLRSAYHAVKTRGLFRIVLAGGNTPRHLYARLARSVADWAQWHIYFGDERCVPVGDAERNDRLAYEAWLNYVAIPRRQIWSMPGELGPEAGALKYAESLQKIDTFDLVLLGLGEDGHTASLFPGLWSPNDPTEVLPVRGSPKPPPERISLGGPRLARARQVFFVVAGESKRNAIDAWRKGEPIPASAIAPNSGVDIMLDATAWPEGRM